MVEVPLALDIKKEANELRSTILHHLGDNLYQRPSKSYDDLEVPEPLASSKAIGTPPATKAATFGTILTFKNNTPFALLSLSYDPGDGISYRLGAHAGWHKAGTDDDVHEYYEALDAVLKQMGALADSYRFTCPCGTEKVINGGYTDVMKFINTHNEEGHPESRISTSTLVNREILVNTPAQQPQSGQAQQANS